MAGDGVTADVATSRRPAVPYGRLDRKIIREKVEAAQLRHTPDKRERELVRIVWALAERIDENEAIIAEGSPPGDGPRRLDP
jgi:hypothetical protein